MTFSIYDLEILTDAVVFAVLVTIGGLVFWLVGKRLSHGNRPLRDARLALASAALLAVGAAGVALRSTVDDAVPVAATIAAAPVDGRAEARPSFRPEEPTFAPGDGSSKRPEGSARSVDAADPVSADDGASTESHADDPGSGLGSDTVAGPPSVGVEGPDAPQDDPPQQPDDPPDDPPDEDPIDAPDTDTDGDDDTDTDGNDEGSGQGPDGQGPPGQGGGGPPGQGPDGQGPPGHSGDS
jgi:hypothetical protein